MMSLEAVTTHEALAQQVTRNTLAKALTHGPSGEMAVNALTLVIICASALKACPMCKAAGWGGPPTCNVCAMVAGVRASTLAAVDASEGRVALKAGALLSFVQVGMVLRDPPGFDHEVVATAIDEHGALIGATITPMEDLHERNMLPAHALKGWTLAQDFDPREPIEGVHYARGAL